MALICVTIKELPLIAAHWSDHREICHVWLTGSARRFDFFEESGVKGVLMMFRTFGSVVFDASGEWEEKKPNCINGVNQDNLHNALKTSCRCSAWEEWMITLSLPLCTMSCSLLAILCKNVVEKETNLCLHFYLYDTELPIFLRENCSFFF